MNDVLGTKITIERLSDAKYKTIRTVDGVIEEKEYSNKRLSINGEEFELTNGMFIWFEKLMDDEELIIGEDIGEKVAERMIRAGLVDKTTPSRSYETGIVASYLLSKNEEKLLKVMWE